MALSAILEACSKLAWPVLTCFIFWKLYPEIKKTIDSRGFKIKIGEMEVTVQQANDQMRNQLEDIREKVSAQYKPMQKAGTVTSHPKANIKSLLWVDDNPVNNAYELARLKSDGYEIHQAKSTAEAIGILKGSNLLIDAVISDMGRNEEGKYNPDAGLQFIAQARAANIKTPIYVYTTAKHATRTKDQVKQAGGNGTTKSFIELTEMMNLESAS